MFLKEPIYKYSLVRLRLKRTFDYFCSFHLYDIRCFKNKKMLKIQFFQTECRIFKIGDDSIERLMSIDFKFLVNFFNFSNREEVRGA